MADKVKFKQIGKEAVDEIIAASIPAIVDYLSKNDFQQANEAYKVLARRVREIFNAMNSMDN